VKRLVQTSRGPISIGVVYGKEFGLGVTVAVFGEDGWVSTDGRWFARGAEEPLEVYLADLVGLDRDEAHAIAEETLRQWRERGGEDRSGFADRVARAQVIARVAAVLLLAATGPLALLAALGFLAVKALRRR
jgi:hypothetical protein